MDQSLRLTTRDGVTLAGTYVSPDHPHAWVVLVHMMPATKESFAVFAVSLARAGIASLAIDLRGHGASDGGPLGYEAFSDEDHQRSELDIDAAIAYLHAHEAVDERTVIVGASIGANLSLRYFALHRTLPAVVLLSPGLEYRGIAAKEDVVAIERGRGIFIVSSHDDGYNAQEAMELWGLIPDGVIKQKELYAHAGHGTAMLEKESALTSAIIQFIQNRYVDAT
ncbi:MAG: alpha/beta fold hydrolase [Candidatus Paceibacterota bacterium]|jgi:alpha-beta hydrolase superfamily lysophospholipase